MNIKITRLTEGADIKTKIKLKSEEYKKFLDTIGDDPTEAQTLRSRELSAELNTLRAASEKPAGSPERKKEYTRLKSGWTSQGYNKDKKQSTNEMSVAGIAALNCTSQGPLLKHPGTYSYSEWQKRRNSKKKK